MNVSQRNLRNRDFIDEIVQAIVAGGQAAEMLKLEVAESLVMEDIENNIVQCMTGCSRCNLGELCVPCCGLTRSEKASANRSDYKATQEFQWQTTAGENS